MSKNGVGVSSLRKEDDRYLRGRGEFVGDIQLPGLRHVAFLRSPIAHGRLGSIVIPDSVRKQVFLATDLKQVAPIRARSALPGFKASDQPVLATTKVRHVGELIAMCVADTRAQAEDIEVYIDVPTAAALFPKEVYLPPRKWAEARYNIVQWTEMPRGGHFAALEEPELYIEDVRKFFGSQRKVGQ